MNIAIVHSDLDLLDQITQTLGGGFDYKLCFASENSKAIDLFALQEKIDLIICERNGQLDQFYNFVSANYKQTPIIYINAEKGTPPLSPSENLASVVDSTSIAQELPKTVQTFFKKNSSQNEEQSYIKTHVDMLLRNPPLKADVFLRLSPKKFVKICKAGNEFSPEDYDKYVVQKCVSHFYLKKEEIGNFLVKTHEEALMFISGSSTTPEEAVDSVANLSEVTFELASRLGFTPEVQKLVRDNVLLTLKTVGKNIKLSKLISNSKLKEKNYLSTHSILLAISACCLAAELKWTADQTLHKLILSAILHDISITEPDLAKIKSLEEFKLLEANLDDRQKNIYLKHSTLAADLTKTMKEIPSDIDIIISQHHEYPNGSGFPRGLTSLQIAPLAAILIIAHDIVDFYYENQSSDPDLLKTFFETKKEVYTSGTFKKIAAQFLK